MRDLLRSAELVIGSTLHAAGANAAWRRLGLPGGHARERVDKLFPGSEVAAVALDVFASGAPSENVPVRIDRGGEDRYLLAGFYPSSTTGKPKQVLMRAAEMDCELVFDSSTGQILQANEPAQESFGAGSVWRAGSLKTVEQRRTALAAVAQNGSHYLGRFQHRRPDGRQVELEAVLVLTEEGTTK